MCLVTVQSALTASSPCGCVCFSSKCVVTRNCVFNQGQYVSSSRNVYSYEDSQGHNGHTVNGSSHIRSGMKNTRYKRATGNAEATTCSEAACDAATVGKTRRFNGSSCTPIATAPWVDEVWMECVTGTDPDAKEPCCNVDHTGKKLDCVPEVSTD
jgi:hypothetical protein